MASADLLVLLERRRPWRKPLGAVAVLGALFAALAVLEPGSIANARARLQRLIASGSPATQPLERVIEPASTAANSAVQVSTTQPAAGAHIAEHLPAAGTDADNAGSAGADDSTGAHAAATGASAEMKPPQLHSRKLVDWLGEIASSADRGLILAPDVAGEATAVFDASTSWQDRLDALARINGFHYAVGERLIEVWSHARANDAAQASRSDVPADVSAGAGNDSSSTGLAGADAGALAAHADPPRSARVMRPTHARAADLVAALSKAARAGHVEVAPDGNSNSVVVAGPEDAVAEIERLVWALDVPRRRFVLEAEIVELSRTARQELGVRWSIDGTVGALVDFPAADAPGESGSIIIATDGAHALRARISALEADGRVRVVSRPRVVVLEGRSASIESVRILRVRFPSSSVVGNVDDGTVAASRAFEEIPVGVTLKVEPSMQTDGRIVLRIRAKSSTLGPPQPPDNIPEELSRMVDAEIAVADGETAVLGGLRREGSNRSGSGVPRLRSVPVLGALFGRREHQDEDEELVVLVTPRLISS